MRKLVERVKELREDITLKAIENKVRINKLYEKKDGGMTYILEILGVATVIILIIGIASGYKWDTVFTKVMTAVTSLIDKITNLWK